VRVSRRIVMMQDTKTHSDNNRRHSERDCHRSTTTQLWNNVNVIKPYWDFCPLLPRQAHDGEFTNFVRPCMLYSKTRHIWFQHITYEVKVVLLLQNKWAENSQFDHGTDCHTVRTKPVNISQTLVKNIVLFEIKKSNCNNYTVINNIIVIKKLFIINHRFSSVALQLMTNSSIISIL
jgi:hypothetical protein